MLSADQLESFNHNGYLVVEHVLADSDLEPLEMEYDALLDDYAKKLYRQGEIESLTPNTILRNVSLESFRSIPIVLIA